MQQNSAVKKAMAEHIWLLYYNKRLKEEGLISDSDYYHMIRLINEKHPAPKIDRRSKQER